MAMVPFRGNGQVVAITKKKKKKDRVLMGFNPNEIAYDFGRGAIDGIGRGVMAAVRGIASAFQSKGATRQEVRQLIAPLARSMQYNSSKPRFMRAEGGIMIEHTESIDVRTSGHIATIIYSDTFSWLKSIANQFEEYQIKLIFAWNPLCPATTVGSTYMAFDYDPVDSDVGAYLTAPDYFNTADHCISAAWAPAAISPKISAWLKTGVQGDARLCSPGTLHFSCTDPLTGFLTVKYQVSLRKPQPSQPNTYVTFGGTYTTATQIFASNGPYTGNTQLITSLTPTLLTIQTTTGWKIVTWSTDASVAAITPVLTNCTLMGVKTGGGAGFVVRCPPGVTASIGATVSAPGGATSYLVSIFQEEVNPVFYPYP